MLADFNFRILADVNAALNSTALLLLIIALLAIRRGNEKLHIRMMLSATGVSTLFLISYLVYHFNRESVSYQGQGFWRVLYYSVLISHIILAVVMVPMILITLYRGLTDQREKHKKIAPYTAAIWLYVSATGVLYYVILYWT